MQPSTQTILTFFYWIGGWAAAMYIVFKWLLSFIYPHLMYLSLVTRLFK